MGVGVCYRFMVSFFSGMYTSVVSDIFSWSACAWSSSPCTRRVRLGFRLFMNWMSSFWSACPESSICSMSAWTVMVSPLFLRVLFSLACLSGLSSGRNPEVNMTLLSGSSAHCVSRLRLAPAWPNPEVAITMAGSLIWRVRVRCLTCRYLKGCSCFWTSWVKRRLFSWKYLFILCARFEMV